MRLRWNLSALALAIALAACGSKSPPTATPEPAVVRFAYQQSALSTYYQELESSFESANPSLDVVLLPTSPYSALQDSASPADVAEIDQLAIAELARAGLIRSLEPLLQEAQDLDLAAFYEGSVSALRWQGQLWGLPSDVDPWVLYYNQDLFDAAGLDYPTADWNWDELLAAAMQLSDPTATSPVYGLLLDTGRADFVPLVYQNGGTLVDSLVAPTTVTFTDPATVEAVEWYIGLSLSQGVAPTPQELRALGGFYRAVVGQRGAMWYGPLSDRGGASWGYEWPFNWGVVAPPGNIADMTLITMQAYVIGAGTQQVQASWAWARYLAEHPATTRDVPPLVEVAHSEAFRSALRADVAQAVTDAMAIGHTIPATTWVEDVANWLGEAMSSVYQGDLGVAQALQAVQGKAEDLLAQQGLE